MRQVLVSLSILAVIAAALIGAVLVIGNSMHPAASPTTPSNNPLAPSAGNPEVLPDGTPVIDANKPAVTISSGEPKVGGADLSARADQAITEIAQSKGHMDAGDAFKSAGQNSQAYVEYLKAYQIRREHNATKRELREVLYKMRDVVFRDSEEGKYVEGELTALSEGAN